jgi:hypothetical protein
MPEHLARSPWDFSEALKLLNDLPGQKTLPQHHAVATTAPSNVAATPHRQSNGLGDFSKIYAYLGIENNISKPLAPSPFQEASRSELNVPDPSRPPPPGPTIKDDAYASDGAVYTKKNVRFNDDADFVDATDALDSPTSEDTPGPGSPSKTKKSKREKKAALKEKKKAINAAKIAGKVETRLSKATLRLKSASDIDSEADICKPKKTSPALKAGVHSQSSATTNMRETSQKKNSVRSKVVTPSAPIQIPSTPTGASNKSKKKSVQALSASSSPAKILPHMPLHGAHLVPGPITPKIKKAEIEGQVTPQAENRLEQNNDFFTSLHFPPPLLQPSVSILTTPNKSARQVPHPLSAIFSFIVASHTLLKPTTVSNEARAMAEQTISTIIVSLNRNRSPYLLANNDPHCHFPLVFIKPIS